MTTFQELIRGHIVLNTNIDTLMRENEVLRSDIIGFKLIKVNSRKWIVCHEGSETTVSRDTARTILFQLIYENGETHIITEAHN